MRRIYLALCLTAALGGVALGADQGAQQQQKQGVPPWIEFETGGRLMGHCTDASNAQRGTYCLGYVAGAADMAEFFRWAEHKPACLPENAVNVRQLAALVLDQLRKKPELRDSGPGALYVLAAMIDNYCPDYQG
jgi:Rap1a immunity proteins